jgi:hypothetical protein
MPENEIATLGELWIGMPGVEVRAGRQIGVLGELLAPVAALRLIGSSEGLYKQSEALKCVALCNHDFPVRQLWTEEDRNEMEGHLDHLGGRLNFCYKRARAAEKILAAEGWKFDTKTGKASRIARRMKFSGKPVVLLQHGRTAIGSEPIGKPLEIRVDTYKGKKGVIEGEVKRSAPEVAPEAVVARMKPDVLRWIDRTRRMTIRFSAFFPPPLS